MILKASLFNKSLILSNIKRFWWMSALYALVLFFILPFKFMTSTMENEQFVRSMFINPLYPPEQIFLTLSVPIVMATLIFRYIQRAGSAAMMHSLPYNRKELYINHNAAGLVLLLLPIIITGLLLMLTNSVHVREILNWVGSSILYNVLFYSSAVFVGLFTGNSIAQIIFTYILHFLPAGLYTLFSYNAIQLIYGYSDERYLSSVFDNLPIFHLLNQLNRYLIEDLNGNMIIIYTVISAIFLILAYYAYKYRPIEVAGDLIAFQTIRPVFKYGVTVCTMLLGGVYFSAMSGGTFRIMTFGYLLSAFLGYWIAEALMEKSLKIWNNAYKGYLAYTLLVIVLLFGIRVDAFGYVKRIPQPNQVERVYFSYVSPLHFQENREHYGEGYYFESPEEIQHIIDLHKSLLQKPYHQSGRKYYISYSLKNGKQFTRHYTTDELYHAATLAPIYKSTTFVSSRYPVINQSMEEIKYIEIYDSWRSKKPYIISDTENIKEFKDLFYNDLHAATYEELISYPLHGLRFFVVTDDQSQITTYDIRPSYTSVISWLKDEGIYEDVALLPEEISHVVLNSLGKDNPIEISDPDIIRELLNMRQLGNYSNNSRIYARFYIKDVPRTSEYSLFLSENILVSDKLKSYLDKLKE